MIDEKYMELAVRALHKAFDLDQPGRLRHRRLRQLDESPAVESGHGVVTEWPKVLPC